MVSSGVRGSARLSRVTLAGRRRRVDLVLPADEPLGVLLPDVLRLLGDEVRTPPVMRHLVTADGTVLPQDGTLAAAGIQDGAVLRLVHAQNTPAAPVVHDVTDEVADDLDLRAWRWRPQARRWTAGAAMLGLALAAAEFARGSLGAGTVAPYLLAVAFVAALAGVLAGHFGNRGLSTALVVTGGAVGVLGARAWAEAQGWPPDALWAAVGCVAALTLVLLGVFSPVGRGGLIGGSAVVAAGVGWEMVAALVGGAQDTAGQSRLGAVLAVVSVVGLGMLPRFALMTAGLTALDDRRASGVSVSRYEVTTALAAAHRGLTIATVVVAASASGAGWLTVATPSVWTTLLTVLVALVLASRARAFPLVAQVVVLHAAAAVLLVRLVAVWIGEAPHPAAWPVIALGAAALVPLGVLAVEPAEHIRVRLRRVTDLVEAAGVVALFPLLLGVFGVYARLLGVF